MSKCIDNGFGNYESCTNLKPSPVKQKVLLPLKVKKILDCTILKEEQNRFLGKIKFSISCNSKLLSKTNGAHICIESVSVSYNDISVIAPQIMMTVNGREVILDKVNGIDNSYEGKINTFDNCCCSEEKNSFIRSLITISGIETSMKSGVITIKGNICGVDFCATSVYDGYLNGDNCTYTIVNNARLLQSGVVIATSENAQTLIGNLGMLNQYNTNNFYGFLCFQNCASNWINANFNNEFCINCITPAGYYDGSGTFEAYVYGKYTSSLNLYSISKEGLAVYSNVY